MKNLEAFKKLIERYETITLDEIKEQWEKTIPRTGFYVAQQLTGFGGNKYCSLCNAVDDDCEQCVYLLHSTDWGYHCLNALNKPTYVKIAVSETPEELLLAFRNRAKHMKTQYKEIL